MKIYDEIALPNVRASRVVVNSEHCDAPIRRVLLAVASLPQLRW